MFLYKHVLLEIMKRAAQKQYTKHKHSKLHLFCFSNSMKKITKHMLKTKTSQPT